MTSVETLKTYIGGFDVSSITGATALAATPADTDELVLSDGGTLKRIDYEHIANRPAFIVLKGGNQTGVSDNTWTKLEWSSETKDTDAVFGSHKFTVAIEGYYMLTATAIITGADRGSTGYMQFYKNGSALTDTQAGTNHSDGDSHGDSKITCACVLYLEASDYIEVYGKFNPKTSTATFGANGIFSGFKLNITD